MSLAASRIVSSTPSADFSRPLDLVHLARATDGDESLEAELLAMFERQADKLGARVRLVDLPFRARADIAHRLRGSALAVGAFATAAAAESLEAAFEAGLAEPEAELTGLNDALTQVRDAISQLRR